MRLPQFKPHSKQTSLETIADLNLEKPHNLFDPVVIFYRLCRAFGIWDVISLRPAYTFEYRGLGSKSPFDCYRFSILLRLFLLLRLNCSRLVYIFRLSGKITCLLITWHFSENYRNTIKYFHIIYVYEILLNLKYIAKMIAGVKKRQ